MRLEPTVFPVPQANTRTHPAVGLLDSGFALDKGFRAVVEIETRLSVAGCCATGNTQWKIAPRLALFSTRRRLRKVCRVMTFLALAALAGPCTSARSRHAITPGASEVAVIASLEDPFAEIISPLPIKI